jgi:hypothetical protein
MRAPRGSLAVRLARIEEGIADRSAPAPPHWDEDAWLAVFEL